MAVELQLYILFNLGARWRLVVSATVRSLYRQESAPVTIVQEGVWVPGPVRTGARHLAPTRT